jgi:type II secretory pathway component PulF
MLGFRIYWACWLLIGFCVPEFFALITRRSNSTLSGFVWFLCDITPGRTDWSWTAVHLFVAMFLIWLFIHLAFGYFR